jgi:protein TonB
MFRYVVEPAASAGPRRAYVLPLSIVTHLILIATAIVVPLAAPSVLPMPATSVDVFVGDAPAPPPPPPPPPVRRAAPPESAGSEKAAPIVAPESITPERATTTASDAVGTVEGSREGVPDGIVGSVVTVAPPEPTAEPSVPKVHVGGRITPPQKIRDVAPIYPRVAVLSHVEGMVIIEATIGPSGNVLDARVLRSVPLLDAAALEAVRQWQYTPTLLNGTPVAVVMTVTVRFTLK